MSINKILMVDHEKCTGCDYCMLACSMEHEGLVHRSRSWVKVYKLERGHWRACGGYLHSEEPRGRRGNSKS